MSSRRSVGVLSTGVRSLLPDYFAAEPRPKSWHGVCCTLAGVLIVLYMISASLSNFLRDKTATSSELVPSLGIPYSLVLRCDSDLPCLFEHRYQDPACNQSVQGKPADAKGSHAATVRPGELHTVILCSSDTWDDGILVAAPARDGVRDPIVSYLLNGATRFSRLPFSPLRKPETCRAVSAAVSDGWCDRHCSGVPAVCPSAPSSPLGFFLDFFRFFFFLAFFLPPAAASPSASPCAAAVSGVAAAAPAVGAESIVTEAAVVGVVVVVAMAVVVVLVMMVVAVLVVLVVISEKFLRTFIRSLHNLNRNFQIIEKTMVN